MPVDKLSIEQFAQRVKEKYPQYKDVNDSELVNRMVQKYPEYKDRINYEQPKPQPAFEVKISEPSLGRQQAATQLAPGIVEPTILPQKKEGEYILPTTSIEGGKGREFSYDKSYDPLAVNKLGGKAREAQTKIHAELQSNDKQYEQLLREYRRDNYSINNLREDYSKQGIILSPQDERQALQKEKQKKYDSPVTPEDIADMRTGTVLSHKQATRFINKLNKPEASENAYLVNKFNELANDPNANNRVEKIKEVAKQIRKGNVIYDAEKNVAIQPLGLIGSTMEGLKNKFKAEEEHDFLKKAPDAAIISQLEDERNNPNTDEPLKVPKGKAGDVLKQIAEMPITPILAGAVGTVGGAFIGNPELGTVAATSLAAYENRKAQYTSTFKQTYNELRNQDISPSEALIKARKQADDAQEIGTIVGAAQGLVGAKMAATPIKFSPAYQQTVGQFLKQNGSEFGKILIEGAAQGGIAATGEVAKNKLAQLAGINREIDSGTADQFWSNLLMSAGIGAAIKAGRGLSKSNYKTILNGLKNIPEETITNTIQEKVANGEITQDAANAAIKNINEYKQKDAQIPANVTEEARFKIQDNIDKLNELESEKEATHKSLQEPIKQKIQKLEEENLSLLKETEKPIKSESGLTKSQEKEATETAEEFLAEGILPDIYSGMIKQDPIGFWKMIAQQAQNRDENWKPLSQPIEEQSVRDQFGDTIVDYAKELFPAPEVSESKISVIQPGEIRKPEIISASKVPEEKIGGVEVSEHGEDTKTAAGQENGIQPSKLSEEGIKEAKELGKYIVDNNKNRIVTSGVERAGETADVAAKEAKGISGKDIPIEKNKILNTWNIGEYDGKPEGSFNEAEWIDKPNHSPKGGESFNTFKLRMELANKYIKSLPEDTHVVSHSKVMRALEALKQTDGKWTDETTQLFLNNKELTNAVQEPSTSSVLQYPQEGIGSEGSERGGVEPGQQGEGTTGTRPEEESKGTGEEKIAEGGIPPQMYDLPFTPEAADVTRLAHSDTEKIYEEMGRKERVPRPTKKDTTLELEADELIKNGYDFDEKANKLLSGEEKSFTDAEQVAFAKMVGALKAKLNNTPIESPDFMNIQNQIEKLSRASDIAGSEEGASLRARRMFVLNDESLSDFLIRAKQANNDAPLTEEQIRDTKAKFDEFDATKKAYEERVAKLEAELAKAKAAQKIKEIKSTTKKVKRTHEDYVRERNDILEQMREKLRKSRGEAGVSILPGGKAAADLIRIAPEVGKLVKSLVEEGIDKLETIVKTIHEQIKEFMPEITERDIHDIIAGEYTKKPTKDEIQEKVYDIKQQAKIINKIEAIKSGPPPKTEKALRRRSQELEALRKQLKGLEAQTGKTEAEKLAALKGRYRKQLEEYEKRIAAGDFEKDADVPPIVLDKEAQELKDKYIEAKKDWELGLARQEYENRTWKQKWADTILGVLDLRRAVGTAFDFSVPFRQALPITINPLRLLETSNAFKEMFTQWYSGKNLDRWWFDLESSTDYKEMLEDGVPVSSPNELRISKREEEFRTKLAEYIPGVKMSNRAASGYLNSLRVDMYRRMRKGLEAQGITRQNRPEVYKELGKYVGNMTGSGNLLSWLEGKPSKALGNVFFGARLMAAKFNLLNPYYYIKMPKEFRKTALIDLGLRVGMYTTLGYLFNAAGLSVSLNPNDSDFLKVKHGNTTYDITGGEAIYVRTFLRVLGAAWQRVTGEQTDSLKAAEKAGLSVTSFFRNKLAPLPSYGIDMYLGKTSWGAKADPYDIVRIYPMWIDDIVEDWGQDKANSILFAGIPSIMGIGVMTKEKKGGGSGGGAGATGKLGKTTKTKAIKHTKTSKH